MTTNPYATSPFSYVAEPAAAPYSIVELMPGVRNLCEYVRLAAGDRVLLMMEHTVDPVVVQAIAAAAALRDADVRILSVPPFSAGGWDREAPLPIETAAFHEADVVISGTWWGEVHTAPLFFDQIRARSARFLSLHMTATAGALLTGARLPVEVFHALVARALRQLRTASSIRVTSARGTDLTFSGLTFEDPGPGGCGRATGGRSRTAASTSGPPRPRACSSSRTAPSPACRRSRCASRWRATWSARSRAGPPPGSCAATRPAASTCATPCSG
ncbi:hypothetical protein ACFQQB_04675 [Nonomuraea rubra]|uniref:hypothetical protein n=1 Tax=Nonomuraea rubra TaxID=46180 RepID=UPI003613BC48